jgi:hypothetical protein
MKTNCRDCKHWLASDTLKRYEKTAKLGFAHCAYEREEARFYAAGWHCGKHEEATPEAVAARKRVGMY